MRKLVTYFFTIIMAIIMPIALTACGSDNGGGGQQGSKTNVEYNQFMTDMQVVYNNYAAISGATSVTAVPNASGTILDDVYQYIAANADSQPADCGQMVNTFLKLCLAYPMAYGEYLTNTKGYDRFYNIVGSISIGDGVAEQGIIFEVSKNSTHYLISMCSESGTGMMSLFDINYVSANNYTFVWSMVDAGNSAYYIGDNNRNLVVYTYMPKENSSTNKDYYNLMAYNGNTAVILEAAEDIRPDSLIDSYDQSIDEMDNIIQGLRNAAPAVNLPAAKFNDLVNDIIGGGSTINPGEDDSDDNPGKTDRIIATIIVDDEVFAEYNVINDKDAFEDIYNEYLQFDDYNYEFSGWFLDSNLSQPFDINNLPSKDFTIYGKRILKKSSIIFVMLDGRENITLSIEQGTSFGEVFDMPQVPTFSQIRGYDSTWSMSQDCNDAIDYDGIISGVDPIYIYEYVTIITYNIAYYHDCNDWYNTNPMTYDVTDNFVLESISDNQKRGYHFDGWYNGEDEDAVKIEVINNMVGDIELYARWTLATYTITYTNCNGYINNNPTTYTINDGTINLQSLQGVNGIFEAFNGWRMVEWGAIQSYFDASDYACDITIAAVFTDIQYHIIINNRDNITFDSSSRYANNEYIGKADFDNFDSFTLETPIANFGYSFGGYTLADGTAITEITKEYLHQLRANNETEIYLNVVLNNAEYTITYHNVDGVTNPNPTTVTRGDNDVSLQTLGDKLGYRFSHWYYIQNGYNVVEITTLVCDATITDIYASWTPIEYTITYVNEHGGDGNNQTTYTIESDFELYDADNNNSAYNFLGWYDAADNKVTAIVPGRTGDLTLTAKWEERVIPIRYIDEVTGKEVAAGSNPTSFTISSTGLTFSKPNITHAGYNFEDMYYENGMSNKSVIDSDFVFNPTYLVNREELRIYISWSAIDYIIRLFPSGSETNYKNYVMNDGKTGAISIDGVSTDYNQNGYFIEYNIKKNITLPIPTLNGFTFVGWYDGTGEDANQATVVNGDTLADVIYYGRWQANEINIVYHINYGTEDTTTTQKTIAGEYATIQANEFVRDDYCFIGWDISATASENNVDINIKNGNKYQPNSSYAMDGSDLHLYAIWSKKVEFKYVSAEGGYFQLLRFGDRNATTYTIPSTHSLNGTSYPVKAIGDSAFEGKNNLQTIYGLSNIEKIGNYAFKGCTGLTQTLKFPNLTSIGAEAFSGVTVVLDLGTTISELGANALAGYAYTGKLTIGSNIKKIYTSSFGGVVYSSSGYILKDTSAKITELVFAEDVEVIEDSTCKTINIIGLLKLTATTNILKHFSNYNYCVTYDSYKHIKPTLTEITIFDHTGVTKVEEKPTTEGYTKTLQGGWSELTYFWNVERVNIDYTRSYFTEIGDGAFKGLINLKHCFYTTGGSEASWVYDITKIGASAFENCYSLDETIYVSTGWALTEVGDRAFANCMSLKKVDLQGNRQTSLTSIGEGIVFGCTSLESLRLPYLGKEAMAENTPSSTQTMLSWVFGLNEKDTESPRFDFVKPTYMLTNLDGQTRGPYPYDIVDLTVKITNAIEQSGTNINYGSSRLKIYRSDQYYLDSDGVKHEYYCYMPYSLTKITIAGELKYGIRSGALSHLFLDYGGNVTGAGPEIEFDHPVRGIIQSDALSIVKRITYNSETEKYQGENYECNIDLGFVTKIEKEAFLYSNNLLATLKFSATRITQLGENAFKGCCNKILWLDTNKNSNHTIVTEAGAFSGYSGIDLVLPYEIDCISVDNMNANSTNITLPRTTIYKDGSPYSLSDGKTATYIDVYNSFPKLRVNHGTLTILAGDVDSKMFESELKNVGEYSFDMYICKEVTKLNLNCYSLAYLTAINFEDESTLTEVNVANNGLVTGSLITLENNVYYFGDFAIGFNWEDDSIGREVSSREFTIKEGTKFVATSSVPTSNKITKLYLPSSVKYIKTDLIAEFVQDIYYAGGAEEWETITLEGSKKLETDCKFKVKIYIRNENEEYVLSKTYNA